MSRTRLLALAVAAAVLFSGIPASTSSAASTSGIVETTGAINVLAEPPVSVELDALVSDTDLFAFQERTGVTLSEDVAVDILEPGDYFPDGTPESERDLPSGDVPAGTTVDSYYFHFDNESYVFRMFRYLNCQGQIGVTGTVTFDQPVLGIILSAPKLNQSTDDVGLSTVDYDERLISGANVTDGCMSDRMTLSADRRTLTVRNFTDIHHDNYRVLVAAG